ncbi:MAG: hypothetical protein V3T39_05570 [Gammaproteobacteria bacterium]
MLLRAIILMAGLISLSVLAEEEQEAPYAAVYSYARIYDLVSQFDDLQSDRRDRLSFHVRLRPRFEEGLLTELSAYILRGEGQIPIEIDANGIVIMPMSPVLRGEDVLIVTNQEEGSLQLGLAIVVERPSSRRFAYADVAEAVEQINYAMRAKARVDPNVVPQANGLTFKFNPGEAVQLTVDSASGQLQLNANENGSINLPYDESLLEENPRVSISSTPIIVYPWFGR